MPLDKNEFKDPCFWFMIAVSLFGLFIVYSVFKS